jgi:hypothetical protein
MGLIKINRNPSRRQLRQFAGCGLPLLCGAIGALLYWKAGFATPALAVWAGGAVLSLAGLVVPRLMKPLFLGLMYVAFPFGWLAATIVLVLLYYLVFTPFGLCLRLLKGDPLARRADKTAKTYWQARQPPGSVEQYFREY